MNRWKVAFFLLIAILVTSIIALAYWIGNPAEDPPIPVAEKSPRNSNVLTVTASKQDLEGIANTYISKAIEGEPLPVELLVEDQIVLISQLTVFGIELPVVMEFDPFVEDDGNLRLEQSTVEVGNLEIPPSTVLSLMQDTVKMPQWMIIRPSAEEVYIDLSQLPVTSDVKVKAKEIDLEKDQIIMEIIIPNRGF
ncbi:YpmS family protein [Chungangia koreensis]|uniref:YpmS family protein n=1 Tax=Chungangia koreensis TaxID=752657 RepID=A0ABV8X9I5_9LACT